MSQKSRAALQTDITTLIHDNTARDITPAQLRQLLTDLNDSLGNLMTDGLALTSATTTAINNAIAALVNSSPGTLDTLHELADALGDDPNFATTMTTALAGKVSAAAPVMPGAVRTAVAAMGANVVDVTKALNGKSIAADTTLTFSGTPAADTYFGLRIKNTDTNPRVITIPSTFDMGTQAVLTSFTILPGGVENIVWCYDGTAYLGYNLPSASNTTPVAIASAATVDLGAAASANVDITGTVTVSSFGTAPAGAVRMGRFTNTLTLQHNSTSLILPTAANITTAAGDTFIARSEGAGNWRVMAYQRANGQPLAGGGGILAPSAGGTGINNGTSTLTLAGNAATMGAYALILRLTAATDVTLPTSGTLATLGDIPADNTIATKTADYTLALVDQTKTVEMDVASNNNLTVPPNSSVAFRIGTIIPVRQKGAGTTTFVAGGGVTITSLGGSKVSRGQNGMFALLKTATDTWELTGDVLPYRPAETLNDQGGSYTLAAADINRDVPTFLRMTSGSANNLTVPADVALAAPVGTEVPGMQYGAGLTTIVAAGGVTVRSRGGALKSAGQYAAWLLKKIGVNEWLLTGDIST